jgi:hypothetical protein
MRETCQVRLTTRVCDTGLVVASILPSVTAADGGGLNPAAGENWVEYTNPLSLAPSSLALSDQPVTSEDYTIASQLAPNGTVTVSQQVTGDVTLAPSPAVIDAALSAPVTVTAVADDVQARERTATVSHVVTSGDPDFDGLYLPDVLVTILDTDGPPPAPDVKVVKQAWVWSGANTPTFEDLLADPTGELAFGSTRAAGTVVWWTYEVTNSGDLPLANLVVTDPELGVPGDLVCEIAALPVGERRGCAASGVLVDQT